MKKLIVLIFIVLIGFYIAWPGYSGYQIHSALSAGDRTGLSNKIDFPSVRKSMRDPIVTKIEQRLSGILKGTSAIPGLTNKSASKAHIEKIVDGALVDTVNPDKMIEMYKQGGDFTAEIQQAILRQIDKTGGINALFGLSGGKRSAENKDGGTFGGIKLPDGIGQRVGELVSNQATGDLAAKLGLDATSLAKKLFPTSGGETRSADKKDGSSFGLGNIKSFGFDGPLAMFLGIAASPSAKQPSVTAQIDFKDTDWKVTKLTPNL